MGIKYIAIAVNYFKNGDLLDEKFLSDCFNVIIPITILEDEFYPDEVMEKATRASASAFTRVLLEEKEKGHQEEKIEPGSLKELAIKYKLGDDIRPYVKLDRIDIIAGTPINPQYEIRTKK